MATDPLVLQIVSVKIGGQARPVFSNRICKLSQARANIVANHTTAQALGYTSVLDAAHNWVKYTRTDDPPSVQILQWFVPAGKFFFNPPHPGTGGWPGFVGPPPNPQFKTIPAPSSIGLGTEIIAVFGQSNADGSGMGRFTAPVSLNGGQGCYAFGEDNNYYTLSDPIAGGTGGRGYDAGPWARLGNRALGKTLLDGNTCNRVVVFSGAKGGTLIEYWAAANTFGGPSTSSHTFSTGSKTFAMQAGLILPQGIVLRITSAANNVFGTFMEGSVTSYNPTTGSLVMNVFSVVNSFTGEPQTDWQIRPYLQGEGFNYTRDMLVNLNNHGITPKKIAFVHGESASDNPVNWAQAQIRADQWIAGFISWKAAVRNLPVGIPAPIYVAQTTICSVRDNLTPSSTNDAQVAQTPDVYVGAAMGQEKVRVAQFQIGDGATAQRGPNLDWIGPTFREDGCHIGSRGLDEVARLWSLTFYNAE